MKTGYIIKCMQSTIWDHVNKQYMERYKVNDYIVLHEVYTDKETAFLRMNEAAKNLCKHHCYDIAIYSKADYRIDVVNRVTKSRRKYYLNAVKIL